MRSAPCSRADASPTTSAAAIEAGAARGWRARSSPRSAGDQRDRRDHPHQPRTRAAERRRRPRGSRESPPATPTSNTTWSRRARTSRRPCRAADLPPHRRRSGVRRQQQRRRDAADAGGAGGRPRGDRLARRAGRDRRRLPRAGRDGAVRRGAARGGDDQPHPRVRLRRGDQRTDGAILRVHPSNFRIEGFTERPPVAELAALAPPLQDPAARGYRQRISRRAPRRTRGSPAACGTSRG